MSGTLRRVQRPEAREIPDDPMAFLDSLAGPTAIGIPGRDPTRLRIATTLLHGNEPSGLVAVHRWLRDEKTPATDALLVIANVEAAVAPPGFGQRMLPGHRDLNRCFLGPFDDADGALAQEILDVISERRPEALIDIHNNTGHNPSYGVGIDPSPQALALVSIFGRRFVWSHLELGALMEATPHLASVTIEVGRSGDPAADAVAHAGLSRFLDAEDLFEPGAGDDVSVLMMPMRVCLRPGVELAIADARDPDAALTILTDLDRHNFERVEPGTVIGWSRGEGFPLELIDEDGLDQAPAYFEIDAGALRVRRPLIPIMITTDARAAKSDCLFYVVQERDGA